MSIHNFGDPDSCCCDSCMTQLALDQSRYRKRDDWRRGFFCAVAIYVKENYNEGGSAASEIAGWFRMGGDWRDADPEDIATFRAHGLIKEDAQ